MVTPNILSDHCLIDFSMIGNISHKPVEANENVTFEKVTKKYVWEKEKEGVYFINLQEKQNNFINFSAHFVTSINFRTN